MKDERITEVGHCKQDDVDVYVGRGSGGKHMLEAEVGERGWLGNPYTLESHTREKSIAKFRYLMRLRLQNEPEFRQAVAGLAGKRLGCWCQRLADDGPACHGEVIAEFAERLSE